MVPPGLPSPWPKRRRPLRWLGGLADAFNLSGLVALLLAVAILWGVSAVPVDQTVEGTVETSAINFQLRPSAEGAAAEPSTGFLRVDARSLTISGLPNATPVAFPLKGTPLRLGNGEQLEFTPSTAETFVVELKLPPGTLVENLHGEDPQDLVVDLRPPTGDRRSPPPPIDVSLMPPAAPEESLVEPERGKPAAPLSGLLALHKPASQPERDLPTPDGIFTLLLQGEAPGLIRSVPAALDAP
jgi:hypothetical protein